MRPPAVPRARRAWLCERLAEVRASDCGALRSSPRPRCGRCFACDMATGEAALLRLGRH